MLMYPMYTAKSMDSSHIAFDSLEEPNTPQFDTNIVTFGSKIKTKHISADTSVLGLEVLLGSLVMTCLTVKPHTWQMTCN